MMVREQMFGQPYVVADGLKTKFKANTQDDMHLSIIDRLLIIISAFNHTAIVKYLSLFEFLL